MGGDDVGVLVVIARAKELKIKASSHLEMMKMKMLDLYCYYIIFIEHLTIIHVYIYSQIVTIYRALDYYTCTLRLLLYIEHLTIIQISSFTVHTIFFCT